MRPRPFIGFSFSGLKLNALALNDQPPTPSGVKNATTVSKTNNGATVSKLSAMSCIKALTNSMLFMSRLN